MGPMGEIRPTGQSEPAAEKPKADGGFPSITRAEQAQRTQGVVREIARDSGWESPQTRDLPKADGTGGLEEGTPLANRDSLTPGQKARLEDLPQPSLGVSIDKLHGIVGSEDPAMTRVESYAAQAARRELYSTRHRNGDRQLGDGTRLSYDGATGARTYHSTRSGVESAAYPALRELGALGFGAMPPDINQDALDVEISTVKRHEGHEKNWMAGRIKEHRYAASRLYERDPRRYARMSAEEFIGQLADYMRDEDELSTIEEVRIGDQSAQLAQVERITSELGPDADVQTLLVELTKQADMPSMLQTESFEAYIKRVKGQMEQDIMLAEAKARQLRTDMASKYGGEAPPDTTASAHDVSEEEDPFFDHRGYN
jgi:hypothetical protein